MIVTFIRIGGETGVRTRLDHLRSRDDRQPARDRKSANPSPQTTGSLVTMKEVVGGARAGIA